jgi:hypothetical protein
VTSASTHAILALVVLVLDERTLGAAALLRDLMAGARAPLERTAIERELPRWIGFEFGWGDPGSGRGPP